MQSEETTRTSEVATYVTIAQAAARIGVSPDTIRRRITEHKTLPAVKFAGKYLIAVSDLEAMLRRAA